MTVSYDGMHPGPFGLGTRGLLGDFLTRRAFFSFHYADIMRVNNVRNAWKLDEGRAALIDASLWESKKTESSENLKATIRSGMNGTSVVCVLVGTETWARRWVRYEIARSDVDEKGLLAVHVNGINHHQRKQPDPLGANPLDHVGVFDPGDGNVFLMETDGVVWRSYLDYVQPVKWPKYLPRMPRTYVPLSAGAREYDWRSNGKDLIGSWVDSAATQVGR